MKITQKLLAALIAAVMLLSAAPVTGLNFTAEAKSSTSSQQTHKHKKVTTVKKATLSKNGTKTVKCSTCKKTLSRKTIYKIASVKLKSSSYSYTGKEIKAAVVVKDSKGKALKAGTDYTVTYKNNKKVGKATATVTFKGDYSGTKKLGFSIVPKLSTDSTKDTVTVSWTKVPGAKTYKAALYNGKKLVKTVNTKKTSAKFTSLSPSTSYTVKLTALNGKKTVTSATAKIKTAAKISGKYKTTKFNDIVSKGTYLMTFTTNDKELGDTPITVAAKNGNTYVKTKFEGMDCKMIILAPKKGKKNPTAYLVLDKFKVYAKMPSDALQGIDMDSFVSFSEPVGKISVSKVKQGKKTLTRESFKTKDGTKTNLYFDGNTPVKRVETGKDGTKTVINISKFSTKVPDSLFKIPSNYRYISLSFLSAF